MFTNYTSLQNPFHKTNDLHISTPSVGMRKNTVFISINTWTNIYICRDLASSRIPRKKKRSWRICLLLIEILPSLRLSFLATGKLEKSRTWSKKQQLPTSCFQNLPTALLPLMYPDILRYQIVRYQEKVHASAIWPGLFAILSCPDQLLQTWCPDPPLPQKLQAGPILVASCWKQIQYFKNI